jgi:hypothetical protein
MGIKVDRPAAHIYEYKKEKLILAFGWAKGSNIPTSIVICPATQTSGELVIFENLRKNWGSEKEALELGIKAAERFIDDHWEY